MNAFIAELATTNLRIAVGLVEAMGFVVFALTSMWLGKPLNESTLITVGAFVLIQQGLDTTQFIAKRLSYAPEAHETPPREDVQPPKPTPEAP